MKKPTQQNAQQIVFNKMFSEMAMLNPKSQIFRKRNNIIELIVSNNIINISLAYGPVRTELENVTPRQRAKFSQLYSKLFRQARMSSKDAIRFDLNSIFQQPNNTTTTNFKKASKTVVNIYTEQAMDTTCCEPGCTIIPKDQRHCGCIGFMDGDCTCTCNCPD